jgi:hypothetical protein
MIRGIMGGILKPDAVSYSLLRLGGRIGSAKLPYDVLRPPLLPGRHPLTDSIIHIFYEETHHAGTDYLFSQISQHFWIAKGREVVKKIRLMPCLYSRKSDPCWTNDWKSPVCAFRRVHLTLLSHCNRLLRTDRNQPTPESDNETLRSSHYKSSDPRCSLRTSRISIYRRHPSCLLPINRFVWEAHNCSF